MAIVDTKSDAYDVRNADRSLDLVDPLRNRGMLRSAIGTVANLAGDSNGSVYRLWAMPSRAILRPETKVDLQDWGFASARIGLAQDGITLEADGLLGATTVSGLSDVTTPIALFGAKWGMPVWEAAGLAADPGGVLDVVITTGADAAGAGSATFDAVWQID